VNQPPNDAPPVQLPPVEQPRDQPNRPKDPNPVRDNNPPKDNPAKANPLQDKVPPVPPGGRQAKEYTYIQSTGQFKLGAEVLGTGYSGKGAAKNNAKAEKARKLGPVPAGDYTIIGRIVEPDGAVRFKLNPMANTTNRWPIEEFWIAPETNPPGNNPAGYIVLQRETLDRIEYQENPYNRLKVVP
jgi:hypothetical protein